MITLDEVLQIAFPAKHRWSPAGSLIAFIRCDFGDDHLWAVDGETGASVRLSDGAGRVTDFDWHPRGTSVAYVQDGDIWVCEVGSHAAPVRIVQTPVPAWAPRWSPDGDRLAFARDDGLWIWRPADGIVRAYALPGRPTNETTARTPPFAWAPDGSAAAVAYEYPEARAWDLAVLALGDGRVVWKTRTPEPEGPYLWIDARRLYYAATTDLDRHREHCVVDLSSVLAESGSAEPARPPASRPPAPRPEVLHVEADEKGLLFTVEPQRSPDGRALLLVLRHTGWDHLYLLDVSTGALRQLTDGECEDTTQGADPPQWSPDGRHVLFASSRSDPGHRQLWTVDVHDGNLRQLTRAAGAAVAGAWSSDGRRIAYLSAGPRDGSDLWVMDASGESARRLTSSLPQTWTREKMVAPAHVTFRSEHELAQDWTIHGYLYTPPVMEPGRQYPALVWVHGGPMRQAGEGWYPSYADAIFHAFTLYLAHRGIATLAVNYRGGVGYGAGFEQGNYLTLGAGDVADVAHAGQYLKTLPFVDPDRVGVWGISYGGRMTIGALTRHPEVFALGIELAGVWDESVKTPWAERHYPVAAAYFKARLGGYEETCPDAWQEASPGRWAHQMRAPLIGFHGTSDAAVPFGQFDELVKGCLAAGKVFEAHYYPEESHVFTYRRTWADVFRKIELALDRYLSGDRPPGGGLPQ